MMKNLEFSHILLTFMVCQFLLGCSPGGSDLPGTVAVDPDFFRVPKGGTVQFSANVSGTLEKGVTWSLNGPGAIDPQTGRYVSDVNGQETTATVLASSQDGSAAVGSGGVGITEFIKLQGEKLFPGVDELRIGGLLVKAGQTIDLNEDDLLDLVTRSISRNEVSFFGGKGSELFVEKAISVNDPTAMIVGDFIVSGGFLADLAVASAADQKIYFIQAVSGTWESQSAPTISNELSFTGRTPVSMATGKFHDTLLDFPTSDLIIGTEDSEIVFFRQDRDFAFSLTETGVISVGGRPIQMIAADFNQDGLLDLAVVREGQSELLMLFGDGNTNFPSSGTIAFPAIITFITNADFNGDQVPDLVAAHAGTNQLSVLLGNGDGTFGQVLLIPLESAPGQITVADFNVGENDDIAVSLPNSNALFLLFGDGTGQFIGDWRFSTDALSPTSLISGFFTGFQAPQGFQSVELAYLGIDGASDQFFLLSNKNF